MVLRIPTSAQATCIVPEKEVAKLPESIIWVWKQVRRVFFFAVAESAQIPERDAYGAPAAISTIYSMEKRQMISLLALKHHHGDSNRTDFNANARS